MMDDTSTTRALLPLLSYSSRRLLLLTTLLSAVILQCHAADPLPYHDLVVVEPSGDAVIRLRGYDLDGDQLSFSVTALPSSGSLYQLSQVFSSYGYEPKNGKLMTSTPTVVTGSNSRVFYKRPSPDAATNQKWGTFSYTVSDGKKTSFSGVMTLVPPSGALVGSNFLLSNEGWTIVGNKALSAPAKHEPYSRGQALNQYVLGTEDKINVAGPAPGAEDSSLWFFRAPPAFLGNQGIAYGGQLKFTLASFSGDFLALNSHAPLVRLDCASCKGPVGKGITLVFPLSTALQTTPFSRDGASFSLSLTEGAGWLKDPQNVLQKWAAPSRCDLLQVLSRLSSMDILGDLTVWYETVALDNVQLLNTAPGRIPVCAMSREDASSCSCDASLGPGRR